jgi:hypothetical protein
MLSWLRQQIDAEQYAIWEHLLFAMLQQHMQGEPVTYPQGVVGFEAAMSGPASYRVTAKLADGTTVSSERSLMP